MIRNQPFARALNMMAAIAAAMAAHPVPGLAQRAAIDAIGPYESRGKGRGGRNGVAPGAGKANHRKAMKLRRVKAHRARA